MPTIEELNEVTRRMWPQHPVAESLYEPCIATQVPIDELKGNELVRFYELIRDVFWRQQKVDPASATQEMNAPEDADGSSVVERLHLNPSHREAQEAGGSIPPLGSMSEIRATQGQSAEIPVTDEMTEAGWTAFNFCDPSDDPSRTVTKIYRAMVPHAPDFTRPDARRYLAEHASILADRDAWSARCAALMTELDTLRAEVAEMFGLFDEANKDCIEAYAWVTEWRERARTAEARLAERDASLRRAVGRR